MEYLSPENKEPSTAREEFNEAVKKSYRKLLERAMKLTRNLDEAKDLVQATLVRALENLDSYEQGTNIENWFFKILINLFYTLYKRRAHLRNIFKEHEFDEDFSWIFEGSASEKSRNNSGIDHEPISRKVMETIGKLPDHEKEIIQDILEGKTQEEIGGGNTGTGGTRIFRARTALRQLLIDLDPTLLGK